MLYGDEDFRFIEWLFGREFADKLRAKQREELAELARQAVLKAAVRRARRRASAATRPGPYKPPR
jgi:hypothetical protein